MKIFLISILILSQQPAFAQTGVSTELIFLKNASKPQDLPTSKHQIKATSDTSSPLVNDKKELNPKPKLMLGSEGVGGGDSAEFEGTRELLDLVEKEELEYFIPKQVYGRTVGSPMIAQGLAGLASVNCNDVEYVPGCRFLPVMLRAYGIARLDGQEAFDFHYSPPLKLGVLKLNNRFIDPLDEYVRKGYIPKIAPLKWAFTDLSLEEINDEGLMRIYNPETKRQLAIQKDGLVVINKNEFSKISDLSKNALFLHEAALYAVKILNPELLSQQGTAPVRRFVARLVNLFRNLWNREYQYPTYAVREAYDALMIPVGPPLVW
jgi:hypothetical protein